MSDHNSSHHRKDEDPLSYRTAGVGIERGEEFARFVRGLNPAVVGADLGGFAGGLELNLSGYRQPVLFSAVDGVGTKLLVAVQLGQYDTLGIDLVAMCVNDLIVCGAQPLAFLDYIACGRVEPQVLEPLMHGIVRGCEIAGCRLVGGETAEMPDLYLGHSFDIAGFAVGIAERDAVLPRTAVMQAGDLLFGLPSSGIHSNGLSLARKVLGRLEHNGEPQEIEAFRRLLLEPTIIYTRHLEALSADGLITAAAHITGGGIEANTQRVLPDYLHPRFSWDWPVPSVFRKIAECGPVAHEEMQRVFNMGIGMVVVAPARHKSQIMKAAETTEIDIRIIGELVDG